MTTDELLLKLPKKIGRNPIKNKEGKTVMYVMDVCEYDSPSIGWLYLNHDGEDWCAYYGNGDLHVCMNPDDKEPPYNAAIFFGSTPNEVLQELYDWCVKNNFISNEEN